jgi:hypothetical protein
MIKLTKGQANTVVLTLTEKSTLTSPDYLFVFTNDQTEVEYIFIAADTSLYPERYNKFTITETATNPDPLDGEVELPILKFYKYTIYEQNSSTNLDPTLATGVVEVGKVEVFDTATADSTYTPTSTTNYVYGE